MKWISFIILNMRVMSNRKIVAKNRLVSKPCLTMRITVRIMSLRGETNEAQGFDQTAREERMVVSTRRERSFHIHKREAKRARLAADRNR